MADGPSKPRLPWWKLMWTGNFLILSILIHLLFIVGATVWVVQTIQAQRKVTFQGGAAAPNPGRRAMEHQVQVAKRQMGSSAPAVAKRITTTGLATFTLPEMPDMPGIESSAPALMAGMGGSGFGLGVGSGLGGGPGGGGGGSGTGVAAPAFGFRDAPKPGFLVGTFYDLKQDRDGKPTNMNEEGYGWTVQGFVRNGWKEKDLEPFFQAPQKLYAPQIFMPMMDANAAPAAFGVGERVQPRMWIVVYRGKVTPNESGYYRFCGFGDDVLVVRWRKQVVLDCGFMDVTGLQPEGYVRSEGLAIHGSLPPRYQGLGIGTRFYASANSSYDIEILVGEHPGGQFKAYLMLMKVGEDYEQDLGGQPKLPIFRLADGPPPEITGEAPVFRPDGPIWRGSEAKASLLDAR
ncbi:MAG: hypothetical protein SFU53_14660 [Terrimicrobiaceae bacterium]|nr:hypothetical protein [Terrimicrobiaceae bacterium]